MSIILYHTECPKCRVLKSKLSSKSVEYSEIKDPEIIVEKGFKSVPVLEVDNQVLNFMEAITWVNGR